MIARAAHRVLSQLTHPTVMSRYPVSTRIALVVAVHEAQVAVDRIERVLDTHAGTVPPLDVTVPDDVSGACRLTPRD